MPPLNKSERGLFMKSFDRLSGEGKNKFDDGNSTLDSHYFINFASFFDLMVNRNELVTEFII
jgi:hypothetical protein